MILCLKHKTVIC